MHFSNVTSKCIKLYTLKYCVQYRPCIHYLSPDSVKTMSLVLANDSRHMFNTGQMFGRTVNVQPFSYSSMRLGMGGVW